MKFKIEFEINEYETDSYLLADNGLKMDFTTFFGGELGYNIEKLNITEVIDE